MSSTMIFRVVSFLAIPNLQRMCFWMEEVPPSRGNHRKDNNSNNNNNNNNNGITQAAFPQSGSSSTWGTIGFTSLSKDGVAKEDHLNDSTPWGIEPGTF